MNIPRAQSGLSNNTSTDSLNVIEDHLVYRRHPVNLLASGLIVVLMLVLIIFFAVSLPLLEVIPMPDYLPYIILFSGLLFFLAISYFFMQWTFWYLDVWIITEEKLIDSQLVTFFLRRRSEIALRQIQDIRYNISGTLATLFRFGDIIVQTASKEGAFKLVAIHRPGQASSSIAALVGQAVKPRSAERETQRATPTMLLGEKLLRGGFISQADLNWAIAEQAKSGKRLGDILIERGLIKKENLVTTLSSQYRIPEIDLSRYEIDSSVVKYISHEVAKKYTIIPVSRTHNGILVAIADPSGTKMGEIRDQSDVPIEFVVADEDYIKEAIHGYYLTGSDEEESSAAT